MTLLRLLKNKTRQLLLRRNIYLFGKGSLPRNVDLVCDLARFCAPESLRTVFDVGANVGQTTDAFLRIFRKAQIFAFEPASATYAHLKHRFAAEKRVKCERIAMSDSVGEGILSLGENSLISHLRDHRLGPPRPGVEEAAPLETVDSYCRKASINSIDFLKTDTEGHDISVLLGADQLISSGAVRFIYCEVGFSVNNVGNTFLGDVIDWLAPRGFIFYGIYDPRDWTKAVELIWADALFVHKSQLVT